MTKLTVAAAVPRLYLGTMSFGWSQTSSYVDEAAARTMLRRFVEVDRELRGVDGSDLASDRLLSPRVDTARIYAGGKTETICGAILGSDAGGGAVALGSKAHPSQPGGLSRDGIQAQLEASRTACGVEVFDEYYLHQPDPRHSLLESLTYLHELVQAGTVRRVGLSNYHWTEVARAFELCRTHGLTAPSVYQGLYNPLNRAVETELLPLLRRHGCAFVAYNPLAAGLLTGKHTDPNRATKGRFKDNPNYLPRFYTAANFAAVDRLREQCRRDGLSLVDATYAWLLRHSALSADAGDAVLLGASSVAQLEENLAACRRAAATDGPGAELSPELLRAFDAAWELTREGAFPYWRSYSLDMPDRESLDPGAAYEASKK